MKDEAKMIGKWRGYYKYDDINVQELIGHEKTFFDLDIDKIEGETFSGSVVDDISTGGTSGIGIVNGRITNRLIAFIKSMPISMGIDNEGKKHTVEDNEHIISYHGMRTLSGSRKIYEGKWTIESVDSVQTSDGLPMRVVEAEGKWWMEKM